MNEKPRKFDKDKRSKEHGSFILEGWRPGGSTGHFNVVNNGCISNLPDDAIVEVPGYVDANGISIERRRPSAWLRRHLQRRHLGPTACR